MTPAREERALLLSLLAELLDYPTERLAEQARRCEELILEVAPAAAGLVRALRAFAETTSLGEQEEVYTGFFDLNPVCYPYLGYHLFGESYQRSAFLLALREQYRAYGFEYRGAELADRLSVALRFLTVADDDACREFVSEGILPALRRMLGQRDPMQDPSVGAPTDLQPRPPQLEGHSEGEILAGGFLLAMVEGTGAAGHGRQAYRHVLEATRLVLERLWPAEAAADIMAPSHGGAR